MSYSQEIERRLAELDKKGPSGRALFEHYERAVAAAPRSSNAPPAELSDDELIDGYDDATADYHRYGRPSLTGDYGKPGSEWNFAIVALAGERMALLRDEMMRRMRDRR